MLTRDNPLYWNHRPDDHNVVGLFAIGPQEARPWWFAEVQTGNANRAPSTETREAILAREQEQKRARLRRMGLGTTGAFTGRNRRSRSLAA
jgi:hypothetical protein